MALKKKKILTFQYFTPVKGTKAGLYRLGQWTEVYPGEVIPAHPTLKSILLAHGLVPSRGQKVYKTISRALRAKHNLKVIARE